MQDQQETTIPNFVFTTHAKDRCEERDIDPYLCEFARKYGRHLQRQGYVLNVRDIPRDVWKRLDPKLKKVMEKKLPVCAIYTFNKDTGDTVCVTTWRVFGKGKKEKRLNWRRKRYMGKHPNKGRYHEE